MDVDLKNNKLLLLEVKIDRETNSSNNILGLSQD